MTDKAKDLMELAKSKFGTLSKSEETLFRSTDIGEEAKLSGDDRVLRADRIVWLCTDEEALKLLTHKGLQVNGARIEGKLDLSFATPDIPITFSKCGYKSHRALGFALGFVVLGTVLFHCGYSDSFSESLITPSDVKKAIASDVEKAKLSPPSQPEEVSNYQPIDKKVSKDYPKFNPLVYSFDVFIPIMNLHQQSYWLPNATRGEEISLILFKCKTGSLLRYYFWVHIVFGWILTSLWVAGFTGLVRRAK